MDQAFVFAMNGPVKPQPIDVWHHQLGHLGVDNVKRIEDLVDSIKVLSTEDAMLTCVACLQGKQHRTLSTSPMSRSTKQLNLIHSDIRGPISPESTRGNQYWLTLTDDYSQVSWFYSLKAKSQALEKLKWWVGWVEHQTPWKVKRFHSDNNGEYDNWAAKAWFNETRIQWEPTVLYTLDQNGVSEQLNRTIMDQARAVIYRQNLDKDLWAKITSTIVYLKNWSPTVGLEKKTLYKAWTGQRLNLGHIRVLGCAAYSHILKETCTKLDNHTKVGVLVGYNSENIYRIYNPVKKTVEQL